MGKGRPGIPYYERHCDSEGETKEERRHEDDGGEGRSGYLTMSAMAMARVRPVRSAAMRMMAGKGRPGIPYYEGHGDGEGETGEKRRHEDDGR